jgi:hypothetical protein
MLDVRIHSCLPTEGVFAKADHSMPASDFQLADTATLAAVAVSAKEADTSPRCQSVSSLHDHKCRFAFSLTLSSNT